MPTRGDDDPGRNLPHKQWERPQAATNEWIKEMRRRTHDLAESVGIVQGTCAGLRTELNRLDNAMTDLRQQIEEMATSDEVAKKVATELHRRRATLVSTGAKLVAAGVVALQLANLLLNHHP